MIVTVQLEFDENDLGEKWLNPDNLDSLLYTEAATRKDLLQVINYQETN